MTAISTAYDDETELRRLLYSFASEREWTVADLRARIEGVMTTVDGTVKILREPENCPK